MLKPMTPEEVSARIIASRFRTSKQTEREAMTRKMNKRNAIADKEYELAAKKEYDL